MLDEICREGSTEDARRGLEASRRVRSPILSANAMTMSPTGDAQRPRPVAKISPVVGAIENPSTARRRSPGGTRDGKEARFTSSLVRRGAESPEGHRGLPLLSHGL